jgi:hypothetical protein
MRAVLRSVSAPYIETCDPETEPVLFEMYVGPNDGIGEELFRVEVCTPTALQRLIEIDGFVIGRHFLFVEHVTEKAVGAYLRRRVENLWGDSWIEVAQKVGRIGRWEFED